jgi:hypothetical protein
LIRNDRFTKTGSGQTGWRESEGRLKIEDVFSQVYLRELDLFRELTATGARIIFNPGNFGKPGREGSHDLGIAEATDDAMQEIKAAGGEIAAVQMPRCFGFNSGLEIGIRPSFPLGQYVKDEVDGVWRTPSTPTWFELLVEDDFQKRLAMVQDEAVGAALLAEASTEEMRGKWGRWSHMNYWQSDPSYARYAPYSPDQGQYLMEAMAAERHLQPWELWLELNRQQECQTKFYEPFANQLQDVMGMCSLYLTVFHLNLCKQGAPKCCAAPK